MREHSHTALICGASVVLLSCLLGPLRAAEPLKPDDLLLIYNGSDVASRELAGHYARARNVPPDRFCAVHVPAEFEEISPERFETAIRRPVREYLLRYDLRDKVRCLVTFYGLPIRISAVKTSPEEAKLRPGWLVQFQEALGDLKRATQSLQTLGGESPASQPAASQPTEEDYMAILQEYASARNTAHRRVRELIERGQGHIENRALISILEQIEGPETLLGQLQLPEGEHRKQVERQVDAMRRETRAALDAADRTMAGNLAAPERGKARDQIRRYRGLLGYLATLQNDLNHLRTDESEAAVDSELALLWWDNYPRHRWILNTLSWQVRTNPAMRIFLPPGQENSSTLIVSRIDAPAASIARRMIDDAIQAERQPPNGRVYIDARGIEKETGLVVYDRDLRSLAALLREHTTLPVELDVQSRLFQKGECPDAMLYCGWYSLRHYIPAFSFVPGAVGYHIASFEAISIKRPGESGWCRGLLNDGITATLGPVAEPYLQAFPKPSEFFGLMLTGRFALAECFAYTHTMNSWMMMLLGDPLYRPFASKPMLKLEQALPPEAIPPEFRPAN